MSQSHDIRLDSDGQTAIPRSVRVPLLRGADDIDFITDEVESALREIASRVEGVERSLMRGVTAPVIAKPGEPGIRAALLLHVAGDGTAFLAVNSRTDRYCTHVVSDVSGAGELQCYGFGHWPVALRPDIDPVGPGPLWLSEVPGMAVDAEPVGAEVVQRIGERTTVRSNVSGVAFCVFKPEFWPAPEGEQGPPGPKGDKGDPGDQGPPGEGVPVGGTTGQVLVKDSDTDFDTVWDDLPSAPVDSVNGQTGVVVLDYSDVGAAADFGLGDAGDVLATNATTDGVEWVPAPSGSVAVYGDPGSTPVTEAERLQFVGAMVVPGIDSSEALITISGGGAEPYEGPVGMGDTVGEGMLVHVDAGGVVWRADANWIYRFATHFCTKVDGGVATCIGGGGAVVEMLVDNVSPYDHSNLVYVSDQNLGWGTVDPPDDANSTKVWQQVGIMVGPRDALTGRAPVCLSINEPVVV